MTTTIKLTQSDIDKGERGSFVDCPHALAFKREFIDAVRVWVRLNSVSLWFYDEKKELVEFRAPLPKEAQEHIQSIDQYTEAERHKPIKRPLRTIKSISYPIHFSQLPQS